MQLSADACVTHKVAPPLIAHKVSHQHGQQRHQLIYSMQQNLSFHHSGSQYIFIDGMHLSPVTPLAYSANYIYSTTIYGSTACALYSAYREC